VRQFYGESILLSIIAMTLALVLTEIIISSVSQFEHINRSLNSLIDLQFIFSVLGITLFTGVLAGSYPAFSLSKFNPITVLKGIHSKGKQGNAFRRLLVVIQFSLSIILIISTLIVFNQMKYMKERDLGFNKDQLLYMPIKGEIEEKFFEFKEELLKLPGIQNVTRSSSLLTRIGLVASGLNWEGRAEEDDPIFSFEGVDYDYIETCKMELVSGRTFSQDFADDEKNYILNESAIKRIGYEDNPLGRMFDMWGREGKIIGVVKDFNFQHQSKEIDPLILTYYPDFYNYVFIKVNTDNYTELVENIGAIWSDFVSLFPYEYHFMDEDFEQLYKVEETMGNLFQIFTGLAVFISCLGLFGLATFVVERRTKEIGVRKVLGASSGGLIMLLIKDFTKWVLLANVIAWPVAWFVMNKWLQNYAYKTQMSASPFIIAGFAALMIAIFTVFFRTFNAANANPVKALKYE
ncbi:ABC transporter permease, partial [Candidatus Cloacimonadota bacterium]